MTNRTEQFIKGDIALIKVIEDLIKKGFVPLTPFSEQYSFDLVAFDPRINKCWRLQCKYMGSSRMQLDNGKNWYSGRTTEGYNENSFDFYACYIPSVDRVIYPSVKYKGRRIVSDASPSFRNKMYWYADFLELKDHFPEQRTRESLGIPKPNRPIKRRPERHKVNHPNKEDLEIMVWKKPMNELSAEMGVTGNSIRKWCKEHNIKYPPQGYWQRIKAGYGHEMALNPPETQRKRRGKLSKEQILEIQSLLGQPLSLAKIAKMAGTNKTTVLNIKRGKIYQDILENSPKDLASDTILS